MKAVLRAAALGVLTAALAAPTAASAQRTNNPASATRSASAPEQGSSLQKKPKPGPFHGKLAAVDKAAKTITVGKRTFQVTSETRIRKGGKPATLDDAVVGEPVSGYITPTAEGRLVAKSLNLGPKTSANPGAGKKKNDPATAAQ